MLRFTMSVTPEQVSLQVPLHYTHTSFPTIVHSLFHMSGFSNTASKASSSCGDDHTFPEAWVRSAYIHTFSPLPPPFPPPRPLKAQTSLASWRNVPSTTRHDGHGRGRLFLP
ncbi:hypothetical protein TNCV_5087771 [Trichonephila clavipes]|nr:hypothetical protein TNCV_5087771 [Trichonephila clavipes]